MPQIVRQPLGVVLKLLGLARSSRIKHLREMDRAQRQMLAVG